MKRLLDCYDEEDLMKISLEEFEGLTEEVLGEWYLVVVWVARYMCYPRILGV
ncbi:MAG: hypothetical protein ACTSXX_13325 [Candidatus Baldrarchaeia archaeon]